MFLFFLVITLIAGDPCTFCKDGSAVTLPDYLVQLPGYPTLPCSSIDTLIPSLLPDETSSDCTFAHQVSSICGCPILPNACNVCGDGSNVTNVHVLVEEFAEIFQSNVPTCEFVEAYLRSFHQDEDICTTSRENVAFKCGCNNSSRGAVNDTDVKNIVGDSDANIDNTQLKTVKKYLAQITYFGAMNDEELERLFIISRITAVISAICCIIVIYDCYRFQQKRRNLYHQLVGMMSIFDLLYSLLMALGTLPMDKNDIANFPGQYGNNVTCKIQGSLMQFSGGISLLLNCSLSTYYLQVVVYNAKESKLRDMKKWMFGVPIILGTVCGFSSTPFIQSGVVGCQLIPPVPLVPTEVLRALGMQYLYWPFILFMIVPSYVAIAYSTSIIVYMLYRMKKVDQNAKKWILSQHNRGSNKKLRRKVTTLTKLRREVFLQCVLYLAAVYVTWLLYLTMSLEAKHILTSYYGLWILLFFLSGIQGFLNCLVYFRPRLIRYWKKWRKEKRGKTKETNGKNVSSLFPQDSNPVAMSTETWGQIAQVEPAVDIMAGFSFSKDSLPNGNSSCVENSKEVSLAEKVTFQNSLRDARIQMEDVHPSEKIADIEEVCASTINKEVMDEQSKSFT